MRIMILLLLLLPTQAIAGDMEAARSSAGSIAGSVSTDVFSADLGAAIPSYQGTNIDQTKYSTEFMGDDATSAAADSHEAQLIYQSGANRPDMQIDPNSSMMTNAKSIATTPQNTVDMLSGRYSACTTDGGDPITEKEIKTCDEYQSVTESSCQVGQIVEVDAKHSYKCERSKTRWDKTCDKTLSVNCATMGQCVSSGVSGFSSSGGMSVSFAGSVLRATSTSTWCGSPSSNRTTITFNVNDINKLSRFFLRRIRSNASLYININGTRVYSLSNGSGCGFSGSYDYAINTSLLSYIRNGQNQITVEHSTAWDGSFTGFEVEVDQNYPCCTQWSETWSENCRIGQ